MRSRPLPAANSMKLRQSPKTTVLWGRPLGWPWGIKRTRGKGVGDVSTRAVEEVDPTIYAGPGREREQKGLIGQEKTKGQRD